MHDVDLVEGGHPVRQRPASTSQGPRAGVSAAPGRAGRPSGAAEAVCARALLLWPGLDRRRLLRTHGDPLKVARLVSRRTIHGEDVIVRLLQRPETV